MTTFRATFDTDHLTGHSMDAESVRTALESELDGIADLYPDDDNGRDGHYGVTLTSVEVVS